MANDPLPYQLTVGRLKKALEAVDENVVVSLQVPAGGIGHPSLAVFLNLQVSYTSGPVFKLEPLVNKENS